MKYVVILSLLLCSCASRKASTKRQLDEVISLNRQTEFLRLTNSTLSDSLNITFKQVIYDTLGQVAKETTGNIVKLKTEFIRDTIIQKDTIFIVGKREVQEEIKVEKTPVNPWKWIIILLCFLFLFLLLRFKKW